MNKIKIAICFSIIFFFVSSGFAFDFQTNCEQKQFVVTAYYSPKDGQKFYYKADVLAEKVLNGSGTHGASGKPVFNGMLAAPSTYDFGGKIYFPSLGIGEIADRGGAIVHAGDKGHSYDRIDIRMGEGEEGLIRALTFGKRTLTGYYCSLANLKFLGKNPKAEINFNSIPTLKHFFDATLFIQELEYGRTDIWVYKLQEYLMKFSYMNKKTGYFGPETKNALCKYQLARGITSKKHCGTFGPLTRSYMKNEAQKKGFLPDLTIQTTFSELIDFAVNYNQNKEIKNTLDNPPSTYENFIDTSVSTTINYFTKAFNKNEQNLKVADLQDMLRHYGFFTGDTYTTYDVKTIQSVYHFQLTLKILDPNDKNNPARGWMGPATRQVLNQKRVEFQAWKKHIQD